MPVRYSQPLPVPEKEFIEPTADSSFIFWLFRYRCIMCHKPATEINEINPRGRSKKNLFDWKNRVTLCGDCHREYHHHGVTNQKITEMQVKRNQFLLDFGREEYADPVVFTPKLDWIWIEESA
jgi:hypothetical protein